MINDNTENGMNQETENATVDQKKELPSSGPLGTTAGIHACVVYNDL